VNIDKYEKKRWLWGSSAIYEIEYICTIEDTINTGNNQFINNLSA
jgi:hypothetical protein